MDAPLSIGDSVPALVYALMNLCYLLMLPVPSILSALVSRRESSSS